MAMDRSGNKRVGVFGGTFDPIHCGHLRAAEEVCQARGLDELFFMPAAIPPHKRDVPVSSAARRLAMIELAIRGHARFRCSTYELDKGGTSYSIDTLSGFRRETGQELYFIIGWDAFCEISTWKDYQRLFGVSHFVVMSRSGTEPGWLDQEQLDFFPVAIKADFCYENKGVYRHRSGNLVYFQPVTRLDISSSMIRRERRAGRSITCLVAGAVHDYIIEHDLYRDNPAFFK